MNDTLLDYAIIGKSCTNTACPLARYLEAQTGKPWSVGPSIRLADGSPKSQLHPPVWIKELIAQTDQATGHKKGPVTREQFLTAVDQVKERIEKEER